jgi:4-amino-4-deoxy-L-arabinose transferase-like glycosyltransferase
VSLGLAAAPALAPGDDPVLGGRRRRWACWRSPEGQPAWARPVLLGIAAAAAAVFAWNITSAGLAPFYSVAVKSMSESWHAFFYGALDPQATITIDKLAGSFLPQALSARIFGFHPWSLALPQVIEGVISVLVMYRVVRRWAGVVPGLLAAGILALTPIAASMFGHSMEDGALTMCLVLAADSYQQAVTSGRLRSLGWAGVWVGLGFQAKMMQAWMILPALAVGYLLAAPGRLRRRLGQLGAAGAVMLAVSVSWVALYTFTPASSRPYVDGSTDNSAIAMVFGYNGLERFGISVPGAVTSGPGVTTGGRSAAPGSGRAGAPGFGPGGGSGAASGTAGSGVAAGNSTTAGRFPGRAAIRFAAPGPGVGSGGFTGDSGGWAKLIGGRFGPEIGWLYPLALLTLVAGLSWRRRAGRSDPVRAGLVMWGTWLLTFGLIYSAMSNIPHTAYLASLAPPLAALSGAGIVLCWRWYRSGERRGWLAPAIVLAEVAWAAYLWSGYPGFLPWARWAAIAAGLAAAAALTAARLSGRTRGRMAAAGLAVGVAAMLAAPAAWAGSVLDVTYAGSSFDASAGPSGGFGARPGLAGPVAGGRSAGRAGGLPAGGPASSPAGAGVANGGPPGLPGRPGGGARRGGLLATATTTLSGTDQRIYDYLSAHRAGASYLLAVQSWAVASPYILATGQEVLPMGGFSGTVPEPALARVQQLVRTGQLRFFLLGGDAGPGGRAGGSGTAALRIASWVRSACTVVPASHYLGGSAAASSRAPSGAGGTASPGGSSSGGSSSGGSSGAGTLYVCGTAG